MCVEGMGKMRTIKKGKQREIKEQIMNKENVNNGGLSARRVFSDPVQPCRMLGSDQVLWKALAYGGFNYPAHQITRWPLVLRDNAPTRMQQQ